MVSQLEIAERTIRFIEHLPSGEDKALVILKGHLLIEELLTELLIEKLKQSNPLGLKISQGMMFSQKLNLCWALVQEEIIVCDVWPCLKELNAIRNKMAHSVAPEGIDEKLEGFINLVISSEHYLLTMQDCNKTIESCLSWLYVMLGQCIDHVKTHNKAKQV